VNHDTHGEPVSGPANAFHSYLKEANVAGNRGQLTADSMAPTAGIGVIAAKAAFAFH
jgi:hypothetical protein